MKSYQISMTVELTIDASDSNITEWEIERHALSLVRDGIRAQADKFSTENEELFCSGRMRTIQTTVSEGLGNINYVNADPLTLNNAMSMWNNMARDVNVFDDDWEIVKTYKELMQKSDYRDSVWSLPELDSETFKAMFSNLRDDYKERSTTLLWTSLRSSVCSFLSNRMEDNLYTLPEPVTPEPF